MASGAATSNSRPLRIGIDARAAVEVLAGRGRYVRELLLALSQIQNENTYFCYGRHEWEGGLDSRFKWRTDMAPDPLWHLRTAIRASRECDVFLATNSYLTAAFLRVPCVVVVHDLLAFERHMGAPLRSAVVERLTLPIAVRRAGKFACVSNATADALAARYPQAKGRSTVVRLAASLAVDEPTPEEASHLPPTGFVLSVGTLEPRKNLPRLARAYGTLPSDLRARHPLAIVGAVGWRSRETVLELRVLGDRCITLGAVSDRVLAELYRRCAVFCYPSLGEGFGLPVLEAMAAGAAVITSNLSSLPEVGGNAVAYADPRSVESIAQAMFRVLTDGSYAAELGTRARQRAALFSWNDTAAATLGSIVSLRR